MARARSGRSAKVKAPERRPSELGLRDALLRQEPLFQDRNATLHAKQLAHRMPLVHFPASTPIRLWIDWPAQAVLPPSLLSGKKAPRSVSARVRFDHAFTYAGPCCFGPDRSSGDAALYFPPGSETGTTGNVGPFDSGALLENPPRLMPMGQAPARARLAFFNRNTIATSDWRETFAVRLRVCYDRPMRYLDTTGDRHRDALPDRTVPANLLSHNGVEGLALYGSEAADRRAWTWEVRIRGPLPFKSASVLHIPFDSLEAAATLSDRVQLTGGRLAVRTLPPGTPGSGRTLYQHSGEILRSLVS